MSDINTALILEKTDSTTFNEIVTGYFNRSNALLELHNAPEADNGARGLFAKKDFLKGETIWTFVPLVQNVAGGIDSCSNCLCLMDGGGLCRCGKRYCTPQCMEADSEQHICGIQDLVLGTTMRILLKIREDEEMLAICRNLSSHYDKFTDWFVGRSAEEEEHDDTHEELFNRVKYDYGVALKEAMPFLGMNGLFKTIFLVLINCAAMQNCYGDAIGLMFDPIFALINHSCERNCTLKWREGKEVALVATRDISQGEEMFVNYCAVSLPTEFRQRFLFENFFFRCECSLCQSETDRWLGVKCAGCGATNNGFKDIKQLYNEEQMMMVPVDSQLCKHCSTWLDTGATAHCYRMLLDALCDGATEHQKDILYDEAVGTTAGPPDCEHLLEAYEEVKETLPSESWPITKSILVLKEYYEHKDPRQFNRVKFAILAATQLENGYRQYEIGAMLDYWLRKNPQHEREYGAACMLIATKGLECVEEPLAGDLRHILDARAAKSTGTAAASALEAERQLAALEEACGCSIAL